MHMQPTQHHPSNQYQDPGTRQGSSGRGRPISRYALRLDKNAAHPSPCLFGGCVDVEFGGGMGGPFSMVEWKEI